MTTDLEDKTIEYLVEQSIYTRFAGQELARRLEEHDFTLSVTERHPSQPKTAFPVQRVSFFLMKDTPKPNVYPRGWQMIKSTPFTPVH